MTARRTLSPAARGVVLAVRAALRAGRVDLADTLETTERERDEARDALRRLKSRPDERRLPCDGDARAEAAMARDAADEADPAWWRGHDAAVRGMMTVVRRALTEPPRGAYGSEEAREVDASIRALRTKLATARREGAEEMRERCSARCEELAEQESELSRAAEARGDQYNAAIRRDRAIARLQAAAELRALPLDAPGGAPDCTGVTAQWCPRCGDCACPLLHEGNVEGGRTLNDPKCPLHAEAALLREQLAAVTARAEALEEQSRTACLAPADDCDCAGCLYAAERGGAT